MFLLLLTAAAGCYKASGPDTGFDLDALPLERLSDYKLFEGTLSDLQPTERLMAYNLNTPLFTDYAFKARHIYLPPGEKMVYEGDDAISFPVGALILKTFYYPDDFRDPDGPRRILETRILARHTEGWRAYGYRWEDNQQDAINKVTGGVVPITWIDEAGSDRATTYIVPNLVECENCHQIGDPLQPLGPKPRNLNREFAYPEGSVNQLDHWVSQGWLEGAPDAGLVEALPLFDDPASGTVDQRARAYLDINCAHCHRPEGDAENSGLYLNVENDDQAALGFCKTPVATGAGSGGLQYAIVPGEPDSSYLLFRMTSNDLDIVMPELGRTVLHEQGIDLIRSWIASLPAEDCN